ncbi:MAG: hypothetical protein ACXVCG_16980 [Bdellovibrionota bacterium]
MKRSVRFLPLFLFALRAQAAAIGGGQLVEDFSTLDHADLGSSSGVWNVASKQARAAAFAGADSTRPITFGDGSDGAVLTSAGYNFDTDSHPNGFQFTSVNITGGTITVTGSHALVIRSLGDVNITPAIQVHSGVNRHGATAVNGVGTATTPGTAVTCSAAGGKGGTAAAAAAGNGQDGFQSNGVQEAGRAGTGQVAVNTFAVDANGALTGPGSNDFDTAANFVCGTGGAGGGGYSNGGGSFSSGGAGGAGGGVLRITAAGNINLTAAAESLGGNGGNGVVVAGGKCSGGGAGGNGGAIWVQTLGTLSSPTPLVTAGSGSSACFAGSGAGLDGFFRGDSSAGGRPAWAAGDFDTDQVPASTTSVIYSKAYDLSALNASFPSAATISQTLNGGQISVQFAGSSDGITFGDYNADLTALSGRNYRYLKFKINITSAGVAAASPVVTQIALSFSDLGKDTVDLKLAAGCGYLSRPKGGSNSPPPDFYLHWALILGAYLYFRAGEKLRRRYGAVRIARMLEE